MLYELNDWDTSAQIWGITSGEDSHASLSLGTILFKATLLDYHADSVYW